MKNLENISKLRIEQRYQLAIESEDKKSLEMLSKDVFPFIRAKVALNMNTPVEVLIKLSTDEYSEVRAKVAKNPNLPMDELNKLVEDRIFEVRLHAKDEIARRNFTPPTK